LTYRSDGPDTASVRILAAVSLLILSTGCTALLGIGSPSADDDDDGADAAVDAPPADPDFQFAIVPFTANVPHAPGFNLIDLRLVRVGGFDDPVTISVTSPQDGSGLEHDPLTIPGDASAGQLLVRATGQLPLGAQLTLQLEASGGGKTRTASVPLVVTEPAGTLDTAYGPEGTGISEQVATAPDGTDINDMLVAPDGRVVLVGIGLSLGTNGRVISYTPPGVKETVITITYCSCTAPQIPLNGVRLTSGSFVFITSSEKSGVVSTIVELRKPNLTDTDQIFGDDPTGIRTTFTGLAEPHALAALPNDHLRVLAVIDGASTVIRLDARGIPEDGSGTPSRSPLPAGFVLDKPATVRTSGAGGGFLWIAGKTVTPQGSRIQVVRMLGDGSLDPAWGDAGVATVPATDGVNETAQALAVLPDGRALVAGTQDGKLVVRRLKVDGTLDSSFGQNGVALSTAPALAGSATPLDMDVQADGRILVLVGGVLTRFHADGSTDVTYGTQGAASTTFVPSADAAVTTLAIGKDGKALVGGSMAIGKDTFKAFVAKLWF
jgi:uncharacterized delta-60 repeat protein